MPAYRSCICKCRFYLADTVIKHSHRCYYSIILIILCLWPADPKGQVPLELNTPPSSAGFSCSDGVSAAAITHCENQMCWGWDANASRQRLSAGWQTSRHRPNADINQFV